MSADHPAPWRVEDVRGAEFPYPPYVIMTSTVVDANGTPVRGEAALGLQAAAPELRDALSWALGVIDDVGDHEGVLPGRESTVAGDHKNQDAARALLARLDGASRG